MPEVVTKLITIPRIEEQMQIPTPGDSFVIVNLSTEEMWISRVSARVADPAGTRILGRTVFASGQLEPTGDPLFYSSRQPGVQFQIASQVHDFGFVRIALKDSAGTFLADFEGTPIRQNV